MSAADDRYNHSEQGRARWRRYKATEKGRAADCRYDASLKGMQTRLRWYMTVRRPAELGAQRERCLEQLAELNAMAAAMGLPLLPHVENPHNAAYNAAMVAKLGNHAAT